MTVAPQGPSDRGGAQARAERMRRAERVYFEVAGLLPHEREGAVSRLCEGDLELAREVRALLESGDRVGAFLERPALGAHISELADVAGFTDDLLGSRLGAYRVERRLASGGMGTVYLASRDDGQFAQQVAIKVVKRGMDSEEVLRRFSSERQTLAALNHANIARLLDAGATPDGRPFLVMEYVDGTPIDEYCDAKRLSVKDRLRLFRTVCDAVHAAHQNLIIHRDLKPSNILVTGDGTPKLLDFGIAKVLSPATGSQRTTIEQDRRLTPEYASPEQISGESVTTSSDVYALGVVLYELLTGQHPYRFETRSTDEVRRVVCSTIPPAPSEAVTGRLIRAGTGTKGETPAPDSAAAQGTESTPEMDVPRTRGVSSTRLRGLLRGDLDRIVMMALRKEPQRRYASAEQFSADIGRYLSGLPVQARRDTLGYRAAKFVRRHVIGTTLTVLAVLLLASATVVLYRQRQELRRQRVELLASNARASETNAFLQDIIGGAEVGERGPGATLGEAVRAARQRLQDAPPADAMTRAGMQHAVGKAMMSLGLLEESRPLLDDALATFQERLSADSDTVLDVRADRARLAVLSGDWAGAEQSLRALLAIERARAGGVRTAREGLLLNDLGACVRRAGRADEALSLQREALLVREQVHGAASLEAAETHNNIGTALFSAGDVDGAIVELSKARELRSRLLRPDHPLLVRGAMNLGIALAQKGEHQRAETLLTEASERWESAFGPDHPGRVSAMTALAQALARQGKHHDGVRWLQRALEWQLARLDADSPQIAATRANIGVIYAELHQDAEATPLLEKALPVIESAKGLAGVTARARAALIGVYERTGRMQDADALRSKHSPEKAQR